MATLALVALAPMVAEGLGVSLAVAQIGLGVAGAWIDNKLFGSSGQSAPQEGPRLSDLRVTGSSEGSYVNRLYGRARLSGQIIWATNMHEVQTQESSGGGGGGKGGGGGGGGSGSTYTKYSYYANFAIGICEGEISGIGRIWADGKEIDLSQYTYRLYTGTTTQAPDSLMEAKEGTGNVPAYRGVAYIVFEEFPLETFGNRIPNLNFEVFRPVDAFEKEVSALSILPGSGEFVYSKDAVNRNKFSNFSGGYSPENTHTRRGDTDWNVSMNDMQASFSNLKNAALVVSWFGTDLRCGQCHIVPKVENYEKITTPISWSVNGISRAGAQLVSTYNGSAAYGGTPSDQTVVQAIQDLKARGVGVTFYPFILMDIPHGNTLPDPYSSAGTQQVYPWRGRITLAKAPGLSGTTDKTSGAATEVAAFVTQFRAFILHYANLCASAGGVDAFYIGTEMRGMTTIRDSAGHFPFVDALVTLAADVKAILPSAKVTYGADWSEYFGYHPTDGSNDVYFHLDPLWSSSNIAAVAIDCYWPLSDWRQGSSHADAVAGVKSVYDLSYLQSNIIGGEGFDWYYASASDRQRQIRSLITDGAGKPWVFRYKDIRSWWSNYHYNRPGGTESGSHTGWVPQSKPFWFSELGCPAINLGSNQPNVFYDPKSSESAFPYFSSGVRDDYMQRRFLQAFIEFWSPIPVYTYGATQVSGYVTDLNNLQNNKSNITGLTGNALQAAIDADNTAIINTMRSILSGKISQTAQSDAVLGVTYVDNLMNPTSSVYGGKMVDTDRIYIYTWDARPYPAFPYSQYGWADSANWQYGHWLNGRVGGGSLNSVMQALMADFGWTNIDASGLYGQVDGYSLDKIMSARDAINPLEIAYFFDSFESEGLIKFRHRGYLGSQIDLSVATLVDDGSSSSSGSGGSGSNSTNRLYEIVRDQESDLPLVAKITYADGTTDYGNNTVESRRLTVRSERVSTVSLPLVSRQEQMQAICDILLHENWVSRDKAKMAVPPSLMFLEPTDVVTLVANGRRYRFRITNIQDGGKRALELMLIDPTIYEHARGVDRISNVPPAIVYGQPTTLYMDLPLLLDTNNENCGYMAAILDPWPGAISVLRSPINSGYVTNAIITQTAVIGVTKYAFYNGPEGVWDNANQLIVQVQGGVLSSASELEVLSGKNTCAVQNADNQWEVIQFVNAQLIDTGTYKLTKLLRGQVGSELAMRAPVAAGALFVLLNSAVVQNTMTRSDIGVSYYWTDGPSSRSIGDDSYNVRQYAFRGEGLRALSPVRLELTQVGSDLMITWIRRTRTGGDNWEAAEVPLGEEYQKFVVEIRNSGNIVRSVEVTDTFLLYTVAMYTVDFGYKPNDVEVSVTQLTPYGRGSERRQWLHLSRITP